VKRFILIIAIFFTALPSFGQKIDFTNSTNVWSFIDSTTGCCIRYPVYYTTAQYEDSAVYNGHFYRYLTSSVASFLCREDSGRVYVIGTTDSVEQLLYDFNLGLNDTIRLIYSQDTFLSWVSALDSTLIAGTSYKVWHFNGVDISTFYPDSIRPYTYNVIEGIGCTNGPYYPASPYSLLAFSQQLLCFNSDMASVSGLTIPVTSFGYTYTQSFDNYTSCDTFTAHQHLSNVGVKDLSAESPGATVIPNPVNDAGKIVLPYNISSGTVTIINSIGQVVYNMPVLNEHEIIIGNKISVPGIYFYRVTDAQNGRIFSGKFVY
jgi:hypothetical protein